MDGTMCTPCRQVVPYSSSRHAYIELLMINVTFALPQSLLSQAVEYASKHRTTLTAVLIEQMESVTNQKSDDPLVQFSRNMITKEQAIKAIGVRDYADLLIALGNADLPLPSLSEEELEKQADIFVEIFMQPPAQPESSDAQPKHA